MSAISVESFTFRACLCRFIFIELGVIGDRINRDRTLLVRRRTRSLTFAHVNVDK